MSKDDTYNPYSFKPLLKNNNLKYNKHDDDKKNYNTNGSYNTNGRTNEFYSLVGSTDFENEGYSSIKEHYNLNYSSATAFLFLGIYNIVFLWSETLQSSKFISENAHNKNNAISIAYNFLFINIICYSLFKFSNISINKKLFTHIGISVYLIFSILGACVFALMGELPYFKHFTIINNFWKHLDSRAIVTIVVFSVIITGCAIIEIADSIMMRKCKKELFIILSFCFIYATVLFYLDYFKAEPIEYHVHHAIFSAFLSLLFTNWDRWSTLIWHSIFMGIVIEGINFYGIGELYLFVTNNGPIIDMFSVLIISCLCTLIYFFYFTLSFRKIRRAFHTD